MFYVHVFHVEDDNAKSAHTLTLARNLEVQQLEKSTKGESDQCAK